MEESEIRSFIKASPSIRPKDFVISDLKWKYLVRSVLRGKNTMLVGPSRSGKTKAIFSVVKALNREDKFFYFNMGSTQDARSSLIGNTFYKEGQGTVFSPALFYKAATTPNAVIMLDEFSRAHPDAWNILMPVLDSTQKYIRLEESEDQTTSTVAEGVTVLGTMNQGAEYTATREVDKAIALRFPVIIETDLLDYDQEIKLVKVKFPDLRGDKLELARSLVKIACHTRTQYKIDASRISTFISTGTVLEMVELVDDDFSLEEIAEVSIYPWYPDEEGASSERLYMRQLVQKAIKGDDIDSPIVDPLTSTNDD